MGRQNLRVKGRVIVGDGQCRWKLELAGGATNLEPGIDGRGGRRWLVFFGEKSELGVFEHKVTMGVNGVICVRVRESKQM